MPKYGVISGPHFPVFRPNTRKYGPEITPYLDTFHAVDTENYRYLEHDPNTENNATVKESYNKIQK